MTTLLVQENTRLSVVECSACCPEWSGIGFGSAAERGACCFDGWPGSQSRSSSGKGRRSVRAKPQDVLSLVDVPRGLGPRCYGAIPLKMRWNLIGGIGVNVQSAHTRMSSNPRRLRICKGCRVVSSQCGRIAETGRDAWNRYANQSKELVIDGRLHGRAATSP